MYHGGQGTPHALMGEQAVLSSQLVAAWTRFAWTGNPNGVGNSPWPVFKSNLNASDVLLENVPSLTTESTAQFNSSHNCKFWESLTHS